MELTLEQRIKNLERLVSALISSPDPSGAIRREQRAIDAESGKGPETRADIAARIDAAEAAAAKAARS